MSNQTKAALPGRTLQDELRAAAHESDDYSLLMRAASALDAAEAPVALEQAAEVLLARNIHTVEIHHHDIEKHAESYNEGYEAAMAHQFMSGEEIGHKTPHEWLQDELRGAQEQAWEEGWTAGAFSVSGNPSYRGMKNPYQVAS